MDAEVFEKRYTAKQKSEIAHWRQVPEKARQSGMYDESQLRRIEEFAKMREMGIMPVDMPKLSKFDPGKDIGDAWEENGIHYSRKENGERWQVDWGKTKSGAEQKQELEAVKEKAKHDAEIEKEKRKYQLELLKTQVPDTDPNSKTGTRYLRPDELRERFERAFPSTPAPAPEEVQNAREYLGMMMDRWGTNPPPNVKQSMEQAGQVLKAANERAW
jgi:hypothetical protein